MVYDFKIDELQSVLDAVKHNRSGNKQALRKRILNLLSASSSKTRFLRQKIIHIYKARPPQRSTEQSYTPPQPAPQPVQPTQQQQNFLHRFLLQPMSYSQLPFNDPKVLEDHFTFDNLPFYKMMDTLLKPMNCQTNLSVANFSGLFYLADSVRHSIVKSWNISNQEYKTQIILRIVQIGPKEKLVDRLPFNITVSVNNHQCKLPTLNIPTKAGITPWRCNVPIDITQQTELKNCSLENTLRITWSDDPHEYMAGVFLAQKLTWNELLVELKKRPLRKSEKTKDFIRKSMETDMDMGVGVDSMFATVKDPLSKKRMELPARGIDCIHLQCFDAIQFLQMNEQKQTWTCPLCKKKVGFEDIEVDEFFLNMLQSPDLTEDCENVILQNDGTWAEKKPKEVSDNCTSTNVNHSSKQIEVFTLSDSDSDDDDNNHHHYNFKMEPSAKRSKLSSPVEIIDEEPVIKSEHTMGTNSMTRRDVNDLSEDQNDLVLDLSFKNNLMPSTSTMFQPITLNDEPDESLVMPSQVLNNFHLPNITITESKQRDCKPSSSESNIHKTKDKSRSVLCVITLD